MIDGIGMDGWGKDVSYRGTFIQVLSLARHAT